MSSPEAYACHSLTQELFVSAEQGSLLPGGEAVEVVSPDGHRFVVLNADVSGPNPIIEVAINVEDLSKSIGEDHTQGSFGDDLPLSSDFDDPWWLHT